MIAVRRFWISVFMFFHGAGTVFLFKWVVDDGLEVNIPILFMFFLFFIGPICVSFLAKQVGILLGATDQLYPTDRSLLSNYKATQEMKLANLQNKVKKWM